MIRHVLIVILGIIMFSFPFMGSHAYNTRLSEKSRSKESSEAKLLVTIWPKSTRVQIREPFKVLLRVVNATEKNLTYQVMSCSWFEHWNSDNVRITGEVWPCVSNFPVKTEFRPGDAYETELQMLVEDGPPLMITTFRMGFTPIGEREPYWSNKVVLGIKPGKFK